MESFQISCCIAVRIAWYLMLTLSNNMHIALRAPLNAIYIYIYMCNIYIYTHTHTHLYIYILASFSVLTSFKYQVHFYIDKDRRLMGNISSQYVYTYIFLYFFSTSVQLWKCADLVLQLHSESLKSGQFTSELLRISIDDISGSPSLVLRPF